MSEPRRFGGKDDLKFWSNKPLQDGHPDLQMPMGGECWEIEYGMKKEKRHLLTVEVISDKFPEIENWRCCSFECKNPKSGETVTVDGNCFKHRVR